MTSKIYTTCAYTKHLRSTHYLNLHSTCTCFPFLLFNVCVTRNSCFIHPSWYHNMLFVNLICLAHLKTFFVHETHPFCYTPIPPYYPKSQTPWFLGPFSVQFPRPNRPKSTQKHQQHF